LAISLQTPTVIRALQRKLYRKAKERKPPRRRRLRPELFSVCLTVKPVGEPDAGDRHVRFDERGWETERCRMAQATAPILDSTNSEVTNEASDFRLGGQSGLSASVARTAALDP
jgi:glutamate/tyrosine decarboxylase-like PLP-dependent enzyme